MGREQKERQRRRPSSSRWKRASFVYDHRHPTHGNKSKWITFCRIGGLGLLKDFYFSSSSKESGQRFFWNSPRLCATTGPAGASRKVKRNRLLLCGFSTSKRRRRRRRPGYCCVQQLEAENSTTTIEPSWEQQPKHRAHALPNWSVAMIYRRSIDRQYVKKGRGKATARNKGVRFPNFQFSRWLFMYFIHTRASRDTQQEKAGLLRLWPKSFTPGQLECRFSTRWFSNSYTHESHRNT